MSTLACLNDGGLMALKLYSCCCVACSKYDWLPGCTCTAAVAAKDHDKPKAGLFGTLLVLVMQAACVAACGHVGCASRAALGCMHPKTRLLC